MVRFNFCEFNSMACIFVLFDCMDGNNLNI